MRVEAGYLTAAAAVSVFVIAPVFVRGMDGGDLLDARILPYAVGFGMAWTGVRLVVFWNAWRRWRSWRRPASWSIRSADLRIASSRLWLPRIWVREFHSCLPARLARWMYPDKGILIGRGFRWGPEHTQELENHLQSGRALPVGRDVRGGHPALHAVGRKKERPLVVPWSELVGHVLIGGTTRSGKTRLLGADRVGSDTGSGNGHRHRSERATRSLLTRAAAECLPGMDRPVRLLQSGSCRISRSASIPFGMCETTTELAARVQALMPGGRRHDEGRPVLHGISAGGSRAPGRGATCGW